MKRIIFLCLFFATFVTKNKGEDSDYSIIGDLITDYNANAQVDEFLSNSDTVYCNILMILSNKGDTLCLFKMTNVEFYWNLFGALPLPPGNEGCDINLDTLHYYGSVENNEYFINRLVPQGTRLDSCNQNHPIMLPAPSNTRQGALCRVFLYYFEPLTMFDAQLLYGPDVVYREEDNQYIRKFVTRNHKADNFPDFVYVYHSGIVSRPNKQFVYSPAEHRLIELN